MDISEAAFRLASTFHGGSTNYSREENRLVYTMVMCKGTLRREFATLVKYPPQAVKGQSKEVTSRLGYKISSQNCGMVDMRDPGFLLQDDFDPEMPNVMSTWTKGVQASVSTWTQSSTLRPYSFSFHTALYRSGEITKHLTLLMLVWRLFSITTFVN